MTTNQPTQENDMTDQTQPEIPGAEAAVTPPKAVLDKIDEARKHPEDGAPRPRRAAKKAPANKTAAMPEPAEPDKVGGIYLPSLPKGYAYVDLTVTGPDGVSISVRPTEDGKSSVIVETEDLTRTMPYVDFSASVKSTAAFARTLEKRAARRAELAALDAEFGEV